MVDPKIPSLLRHLVPFRYLHPDQQAALAERAEVQELAASAVLAEQGDLADRRVFLLLEGEVAFMEGARRVGTVEAGRYFGERAALFETPRQYTMVTTQPSRIAVLSADDFLALIKTSAPFAQALGDTLREKQGLFRAFDAFMAALQHGATNNAINMYELVARYEALEPALHPHVKEPRIDFAALTYVLRRLPDQITETFALYLTDALPPRLQRADELFPSIPTDARRRAIYELMPGKSLVLLRDGQSDLADLLTCLCAYVVEARKLRRRLDDARKMVLLSRFVNDGWTRQLSEELGGGEVGRDQLVQQRVLLYNLGFGTEEIAGLERLWRDQAAAKLLRLSVHHEDFAVEITRQLQTYHGLIIEEWVAQIAAATEALMGADPSHLPADLQVHIISSNTHSVSNCLNPFYVEYADRIIAWAEEHRPRDLRGEWATPQDKVYAMGRHYIAAHPEAAAEQRRMEQESGVVRLKETALTGIEVKLVDLSRLHGKRYDVGIPAAREGTRGLIVNIDYAFGQQAEDILGNLVTLFARNLKSVNVLGKAGAMQGARGALLIPTAFIEQTSDIYQRVPQDMAIDVSRLQADLPERDIFVGPLLTVAGTMLQNRVLLNFYRRIWGCVGLEMEGIYYLREVLKARRLGVLGEHVALRFLYYVSDVPLNTEETLAGALSAHEGVPPLYAITRELLRGVLGSAQGAEQ
jgi:CRP-like cAMP-binding protein